MSEQDKNGWQHYKDLVNWQKYPECIFANPVSFNDGPLGGCNIYGDPGLELPKTWKWMVDTFGIKNVIDVGCGFGFHSKYFKDDLGLEVLGVDGSEKIIDITIIPGNAHCHDYSTGPYVPDKIYDLCWSVEFVEHVDAQYTQNFIETYKKARYLVMTHGTPGQGGHHHVNCQPAEYWIKLLGQNGFELQHELTNKCRAMATEDAEDYLAWRGDRSDDKPYRGPAACASNHLGPDVFIEFFFTKNGLVFKNTQV